MMLFSVMPYMKNVTHSTFCGTRTLYFVWLSAFVGY